MGQWSRVAMARVPPMRQTMLIQKRDFKSQTNKEYIDACDVFDPCMRALEKKQLASESSSIAGAQKSGNLEIKEQPKQTNKSKHESILPKTFARY